jgi:hypothetical protein
MAMYIALAYVRREFRFCVLVAPVGAVRVRDGTVTGRWTGLPAYEALEGRVGRGKPLLQAGLLDHFANHDSTDAGILRFTQRYGPLSVIATRGGTFSFSCASWQRLQMAFRTQWADLMKFRPWDRSAPIQAMRGERFEFEDEGLSYVARTLYRFLMLELHAVEPARLRTCARPDCQTPRFIAAHGKQQYCSDLCSHWAQKEAKKAWWAEHGQAERQKRAAKKISRAASRN